MTDPLHATIEEFTADGYTHIECLCPRCRVPPRGKIAKIRCAGFNGAIDSHDGFVTAITQLRQRKIVP